MEEQNGALTLMPTIALQEKAIKGKQGLGRSSMPKKVAGVHFAGKKTKIVESDDEEEEGKTTEKAASDGGAEDGGGEKGAKKWKKIALRVLREGGGSMKVCLSIGDVV